MKTRAIFIILALVLSVGAVVALKQRQVNAVRRADPVGRQNASVSTDRTTETAVALPKLRDLGAMQCIPCKMMKPILEDLGVRYEGKLQVELIDLTKDPNARESFGISIYPTQIFYDASGKEIFRHEGFWSRDDIVKKFKDLGIDLDKGESKCESRKAVR
jgi:thioredoxin 1